MKNAYMVSATVLRDKFRNFHLLVPKSYQVWAIDSIIPSFFFCFLSLFDIRTFWDFFELLENNEWYPTRDIWGGGA